MVWGVGGFGTGGRFRLVLAFGLIYGRVAQFAIVPEPATAMLRALGLLILGAARLPGRRMARF